MNTHSIDIHDKITEAYFGLLGSKFMADTQARIHWIGKSVNGNNILDIGCSQGIVPILLGREGKNVLGIDIDQLSIEEAIKYLSSEQEPTKEKVKFKQLDYINTNFNDKKFDTVILSEVLEHLMNPEPFLRKAKEDLSEGGRIIITVPFGINDHIDHKQTYYFIDLFELLKKYFSVIEFTIMGKWIGFICEKVKNSSQKNVNIIDIQYLENAFKTLERKYINQINDLYNQNKTTNEKCKDLTTLNDKLTINYKGMDSRNKKITTEYEALTIQYKSITSQKNNLENKLEAYVSEKEEFIKNDSQKTNEIDTLVSKKLSLKENIKDLENKLDEYTAEINKKELLLNKINANYLGMNARNKKLNKELNNLKADNQSLTLALEKSELNFRGMSARNKYLALQIEKEKEQTENVKKTLSFRLGASLIEGHKSPVNFIKLPFTLFGVYKDWKKIRNKKKKKKIDRDKLPVTKKIKLKRIESNFDIRKIKIASIMDEFTYNSFKYECDVMQISPQSWKEEMSSNHPDIVFIESAWKGKDDLWERKISVPSDELIEMLKWCKSENIPSIFWCKEDPVHFDTFIPTASLVDYVFTTDIDCVPKYKKELGHKNVYMLPFAAQPAVQNPIEKYDRKDSFCFAGSYYLRYPERQRDFKTLINSVKEFKPVDIYDRNFEKPHPHYQFPEEYQDMILGSLPFTEIDRAYKGYRYGINMNTIKQSQSMYARRVFELLASNTVCVSNFSRGLRLLFGDLVISSDDKTYISNKLKDICNDDVLYRKFRLLGLRKVMSEHTYADRLSYIMSKIHNTEIKKSTTSVIIVATAKTTEDVEYILKSFNRQKYENKRLIIINSFYKVKQENIQIIKDNEVNSIFDKLKSYDLFGVFSLDDYYGENYLTDLVYASSYTKADAFGKGVYFISKENEFSLVNDNDQYTFVENLYISSSLVNTKNISTDFVKSYINDSSQNLQLNKMLAIDEFNYCKNCRNLEQAIVEGIVNDLIIDNGVSFEKYLSKISDVMPLSTEENILGEDSLPKLSAKELFEYIQKPVSSKIRFNYKNNIFQITSKLPADKHAYMYSKKIFTREELNLVLNSQFTLKSDSTLDVRTVFEFQDKNKKKISHQMNPTGTHGLAIPPQCVFIRFGLKITGSGSVNISSLILGSLGERPSAIVGRTPYLVLTKQYPSYEDLYKYGFLHSRVRAYKEEGLPVDVFRITNEQMNTYCEFEGVDVASGDAQLLDDTLKTGMYKNILVHILDENMWKVLVKYIDKIKITVWAHGSEIQTWKRRDFEFVNMTAKDIDRQKRLSNNRVKFWKSILTNQHPNLHLVVVSNYLINSIQEDFNIKLSSDKYSIIHNYIDRNIFKYHEKKEEDRLNILSIRPYAKRVYANDLTVSAILELTKLSFFNELNFTIIGDGELFEETVKPIREFANVKIIQSFLTHAEIANYHQINGILLVPTRMDTQGVSRDEAMSSGLVPITTNVAAIPEFVDATCGIVVEPENPQTLANAIEYLYKNPNKFLKLSKAASERVRIQSSFDNTIKKELDLLVNA